MKRLFTAVLFLIVAGSSFAAEQTHRYVVAMKRLHPGARQMNGVDIAGREVVELRNLDALVTDLTDAEVLAVRKDPAVKYVERGDIQYYATDESKASSTPVVEGHPPDAQVVPYGIAMVNASQVWPVTRGDGINVAVVDTGIDYHHPELKGIYQGGYNPLTKVADPMDDDGHGTHVSGTIAAADNSIGVVGVAPNVKLWGVKVLNPTPDGGSSGSNSNIAAGLNWVLDKKNELGGNWIVNMSLGGPDPSAILSDACTRLANAGVLIFAAAGNTDSGPPNPVAYPAAFSTVTAVAAVDGNQAVASFSNQGPQVALSGPGVGVFSTFIVGEGTNSFVTSGSSTYDGFGLVGSKKGTPSATYVYCGLGAAAGDFPSSVKGNIALIQRGTATFNQKAKNAITAGATGVVIYNCSLTATPSTCTNDSFGNWTLIGKDTAGNDITADLNFPWTVTVGISYADGEALRKAAANSTLTATNVADDYAIESGTSMSCPHAVGVAALVWSAALTATATDVKNAMTNTAHDLGDSGRDSVFGFGLIDAYAAAKAIAPSKFGSPATPNDPAPGRKIIRRGH